MQECALAGDGRERGVGRNPTKETKPLSFQTSKLPGRVSAHVFVERGHKKRAARGRLFLGIGVWLTVAGHCG